MKVATKSPSIKSPVTILMNQDLEVRVAFGKPIELKNVKLKESALRDANIPLR